MNSWIVVVTDQSNSHMYGPFLTQGAAQAWANQNADAFAGRIVHVILNRPIDPFKES